MNMQYFVLFFLEIAVLFFLSKALSRAISLLLPIRALSVLFLPGVIIHELSHILIASILLVRVGRMEFSPKITEEGLKLGSAEIGKTDPIRRAIIGFAPVGVGISLILGIVYLALNNLLFFQKLELYAAVLVILIVIYVLFAIANTMFSSSKDMEGSVELLAVFLIIFIALYLIGFRFPEFIIKFLFSEEIIGLIEKSSLFLLAPILIDVLILGTIKLFYNRL